MRKERCTISRVLHLNIPTPTGHLEGILKPEEAGVVPHSAALVCHPHPLGGGTMHNKVVIRWKMQATHEHEFRGIAPGGKPVTVTGITILRIVDGKIVERWVNWDSLALRLPSETVNLGAV